MKKKIFSLSTFAAVLFLFLFVFPGRALAATFNFDPSSREVNRGDQFEVKINLDTSGKKVNVIEAVLSFTDSVLEFKGINFTGLFPFNTHGVTGNLIALSSSENDGTAYYQGSGHWVTLTFEAKNTGSAELRFTSQSAVYEIGTLANLLSMGNLPVGSFNVVESGGDDDGGGSGEPGQPPVCHAQAPGNPGNLKAARGPKVGQVTLTWDNASGATHYSILFGVQSGNYIYGAVDIGNTNQFVVNSLTPGRLYYFTILAWNGCASSGYSNEASARGYYIVSSKVTPTPVPTGMEEPPEGFEPISRVLPSVDEGLSAIAASPTPTPAYEPEVVVEDERGGLGGWIKGNLVYVLGGLAGLIFVIALLVLLLPGSSDEDDWQPPDTLSGGGDEPPAGANESSSGKPPVMPPPPPLPTE